MPPIEFCAASSTLDLATTDTRLSRRMTQTFGYLRSPASFIVIIIGCLIFADGNVFADYFSPGDHTITLTHQKRERSAIVHVPPRAIDAREIPIILNFHGGGGHGANEQEYSLMDRLADRETFVAVYPNGTGRFGNRLLTWNAGTCCAYAVLNNDDDVSFVRALVTKLTESIPIDRRRVYATGLSNGAMMSHRLAAEAADLIAAIAPVAGGMVVPGFKSPRAVPVMHIHSVDDPRALYNGGLGLPFPLTKSQVFHPNIDQMIARWVQYNGCSAEPAVVDRRAGREGSGRSATRYVYPHCREGVEVDLWKLTGAGHVWPGGKQKFMERILGPSTEIIDANQEMWNFFKRFALPA
jgi:polyhydroxybutyrate depolymerase